MLSRVKLYFAIVKLRVHGIMWSRTARFANVGLRPVVAAPVAQHMRMHVPEFRAEPATFNDVTRS